MGHGSNLGRPPALKPCGENCHSKTQRGTGILILIWEYMIKQMLGTYFSLPCSLSLFCLTGSLFCLLLWYCSVAKDINFWSTWDPHFSRTGITGLCHSDQIFIVGDESQGFVHVHTNSTNWAMSSGSEFCFWFLRPHGFNYL